MKRYILTIATAMLFGTMAFAQAGAPPADQPAGGPPHHGQHGMKMNPEQRFERMSKQLNLTADQQAKIKPLLEQERTQAQDLKSQKLTVDERREKMKSIHENTMSEVRGILTPEQQTKFDAMQQRMKERRQQHMKGGQAGATGTTGAPQQPPQ